MDYKSTDSIPYFKECSAVVEGAGLKLVELQVVPQHDLMHVSVVIAAGNPQNDVGVSDCSKAHRALIPVLLQLLNKTEDDISMEVCSPGIERNLKNACEFSIFEGREVRVWDKTAGDWIRGLIHSSDDKQVTLQIEGGELKSFVYENIAKAKFIHL